MNRLAVRRSLVFLAPLIFVNSILAQTDSIYRLPEGTRVHLKMDVELSSKVASVNDTFTATLAAPLTRRDVIVLPVGTIFEGRVISTAPASNAAKNGHMDVVFETIKFDGFALREIDGRLVKSLETSSSQTPGVLSVIGGTAVGAVIGLLTGSRTGSLAGAGIGAGAGAAVALSRKGKEVFIRKDQEFEIELKKEVVLPVKDY